MKGKKLVFAVILSLIVCLLLVPSAFADNEEQNINDNSGNQIVDIDNANPDGDNGGSNPDPQNNESTDKTADSGDSESKSDNDSTSNNEGQSGVNDDSSDESKDNTGSDDGDNDTDDDNDSESDTDESGDNDADSEEEEGDTDSEDEEQENASEEETETDSAPTHTGDSKLPSQPDYTGFQVELTYNGKVYKMNGLKGGESHDFAQIMKELGIEGEVESAIGDADDLFNVTSDEKGMHFNTLMAFETEQKLVVTVGGVEYVIIVTDDGAVVEVSECDNLQDKITDAANGTTIKLMDDFTGAFVIPKGKTITIDLNGKTLNGIAGAGHHVITNNGTLTVKGNGAVKAYGGSSNFAVYNTATGVATLEGGTYTRGISGGDVIVNDGDITIKGTAVIDGGNMCWTVVRNSWSNKTHPEVKMTIEGGTFKTSQPEENNDNTLVLNRGTLIIKGGKFERTGKGDLIANCNTSSAVISGGEFYSSCKDMDLLWNSTQGAVLSASGGIYSDDSVKKYVDEYTVIAKCGDMYAVNESGYDFAKSGNTVEIVKAPANSEIDNVPGGVTVKNSTNSTIIINGVTVAPHTSYTTVAPANTITLTNDEPIIKYWVVEGKDQTWTKSSDESVMFTLNSSAVTKVLIDGVEVEFEVDEDGKIIISAEVLEALEAGEHTVEFIFADGNCKTNIIIK